MSKHYGEVMHLDVFGEPTIIIDSYEAAIAILETSSASTSDRPRFVMAELVGLGYEFALMKYSDAWRQRRRIFHSFFHQGVVSQYRPVRLREVRRLLGKLLDEPEKFLHHSRHYIGGTIMSAVYGIEIKDQNDKFIAIAEKGGEIFSDVMVPGRYLVELFPLLARIPAWFPGAIFKRKAARWERDIHDVRTAAYNAASEAIARGDAGLSMTSSLVDKSIREHGSVSAEDEEIFKDVTGVAYAAGADTASTIATLTAFFLAMVAYPDVQRKAQAELDEIVGQDQLPDFSHQKSLPYVNAVMKECSRWHTVMPLLVPHRSIKDVEYNGYLIPAGSVLIPNAWSMSRDPVAYPDPDRFMPERYLKGGKMDPEARDPLKFQFGFGRRICPGMPFSQDSLFLAIASVLHAYNIRPPASVNDSSDLIRLGPKMPSGGALSYPDPFGCSITPRSELAASIIQQSRF
ncbi:cytochrome P450 [Dichomitus squalens LYAD-421 SS1]|uniref:Cytochrome P450 n=1 Tax=Dichomitus squalens (strain LYAD-421) TaxID=732165 RepID=R7SN68_DICSQ|nr:cytochrome P450 [Dichomitus squalens LYAD-421 SS1]EJF57353.1 cytochrome P450 [Dichomitus squalens LYAD-421 SS1]